MTGYRILSASRRIMIRRISQTQLRFNHYETLGVERTAGDDEIKKAYRKLAKEYHPDRPTGNKDVFQRITEAYETLSSKEKRPLYDEETFGGGGGEDQEVDIEMKPRKGGVYYSPEYMRTMHQYQKAEAKWGDRWERFKLFLLYIKQNPLKVISFATVSSAAVWASLYYGEKWLSERCSKFYYDRHERAITTPGTAEYTAKKQYIEKLIEEKIPADPLEASAKFGVTRCEWVIDFFQMATYAEQRDDMEVDLRRAVRFLPFVLIAFLERRIPLDPREGKRSFYF